MIRLTFTFLVLCLFSCKKEQNLTNQSALNDSGGMRSSSHQLWTFFLESSHQIGNGITVKTISSGQYDGWKFYSNTINGSIRTSLSDNWSQWTLKSDTTILQIKTSYWNSWDNWKIDDYTYDWHCDIETSYSENWNNWDAVENSASSHFDLQTTHPEVTDNWKLLGDWPVDLKNEYKIAVMFVPVIVNVLIIQGIIP